MDKIKVRQICFFFAAMMPVSKLLVYPATLVYNSRNDLLFSAFVNCLIEGAAVAEQGHAGCKFRVRGLPVHVHSCRGSSPLPASVPSRFFAAEVRAMTIWPPP